MAWMGSSMPGSRRRGREAESKLPGGGNTGSGLDGEQHAHEQAQRGDVLNFGHGSVATLAAAERARQGAGASQAAPPRPETPQGRRQDSGVSRRLWKI